MRGFSHGYMSSFFLACFLLLGMVVLTEKRDQRNGYEPR